MLLGVVGDESTHLDALLAWLGERAHAGLELAAVVAPSRSWAVPAVRSPHDLVGRVDAVAVFSRNASTHRAAAEPLLRAGLPVFVDKPLALTLLDAHGLFAAARAGGGRLASFSSLRHQATVLELARRTSNTARAVRVVGPTDPTSPFGGRAFYAPHAIELALALASGPVSDATAAVSGDEVLLHFRAPIPVEVRLAGPEASFACEVDTAQGVVGARVDLAPGYYAPTAERIVAFLTGGPAPVAPSSVLDAVALLEVALSPAATPNH